MFTDDGITEASLAQTDERGSQSLSHSARVLDASVLFDQLDDGCRETIPHSKRLLNVCRRFGHELGMGGPQLGDLLCGARLHDIGKLFIDLSILNKVAPLTDEERWKLAAHPGKGAELAAKYGSADVVVATILSHHERWDGKGYPRGLAGDDIPYYARIVALADTYDTIISKRIYDPPRAVLVAVSEVEKNAGTQFDPHLAECFLRYLYKQHRRVLPLVV